MGRVREMFRGMAIGRAVTTADMTAGQAETEMYPGRSHLQAFFTTESASGNGLKSSHVWTGHNSTTFDQIDPGFDTRSVFANSRNSPFSRNQNSQSQQRQADDETFNRECDCNASSLCTRILWTVSVRPHNTPRIRQHG
jgi:hypothetical protein